MRVPLCSSSALRLSPGSALACLLCCTLILMPFSAAAAQDTTDAMPGSAYIAARQAQTDQLGLLIYRVHFDDGSWTHQQVNVCPAFTHYAFAQYTQKVPDGESSSFLAVYALDNGPAHSLGKPWQAGILLLPGSGLRNRKNLPLAEQKETVRVFDRIWQDELDRSPQPGAFPALSWPALADCYARFAGLQPRNAAEDELYRPTINLKSNAATGVLVLLQSPGPTDLSLGLDFDRQGMITAATLTHSARVN